MTEAQKLLFMRQVVRWMVASHADLAQRFRGVLYPSGVERRITQVWNAYLTLLRWVLVEDQTNSMFALGVGQQKLIGATATLFLGVPSVEERSRWEQIAVAGQASASQAQAEAEEKTRASNQIMSKLNALAAMPPLDAAHASVAALLTLMEATAAHRLSLALQAVVSFASTGEILAATTIGASELSAAVSATTSAFDNAAQAVLFGRVSVTLENVRSMGLGGSELPISEPPLLSKDEKVADVLRQYAQKLLELMTVVQ